MKRQILATSKFERMLRKCRSRNPAAAETLERVFEMLREDAFHPSLDTHKLKGKLAESWGCSAGYDLRVVFELFQHEGADAILLLAVGTHDETYR